MSAEVIVTTNNIGVTLASGTVTSITAGTGLTGGTITQAGTIAADIAPSGGGSATQLVGATDVRLSNARNPSGAAAGDLSGNYPNPTVSRLASSNIDTATPSIGDVWQFTGLQWSHVPANTITANAGLFATQPINFSTPAVGDVWQFNGSQWDHVPVASLVSDASLVNYTSTGSGAVTRTVASRLDDVASVKNFGAVGDGVANDGAAIALALASNAKTVYLPEGTYRVTSTIEIPNGKTLRGSGAGTIIQADSVTGAVVTTFVGAFTGTFRSYQFLKDVTISGTFNHAVVWSCAIFGGMSNVNVRNATCTNGFVVDGSFGCTFHRLSTEGSTISNACFWAARDFNANHLDTLYTSNFCNFNFLSQKTNAGSVSPYNPVAPISGTGSTLSNVCCQGGVVGMALYGVDYGGWTINSPYFENVVLPIQLGNRALPELCRSITFNSPFLVGPATAISHPSGPSTHALDIDNAVNITINSMEFGGFGGTSPTTTLIHYHTSHKVLVNNFYLTTGGIGSRITNQIRRKAGADADGGLFIIGEELDSSNSFRAHFMLMKSENLGHEHWKLAINNNGHWHSNSVVPPLV
jgi:hypothetical protein